MQERFNDISVLRCCAMLMIVFYHCICPYGVWTDASYSVDFHVPLWDVFLDLMRNIHLPIFFVLAGYLYGYKRYRGGVQQLRKIYTKEVFTSDGSIYISRLLNSVCSKATCLLLIIWNITFVVFDDNI